MEWLILGLLHWLHFYLVTGLDPWLIRWLMYHILVDYTSVVFLFFVHSSELSHR
jgi:hypothetical protein